MITKTALSHKGDYWINIATDDKETLTKFYQEYKIDEEIVAYSLDKNERAHLDYDKNTNTFVLIFNVPKLEKSMIIMKQFRKVPDFYKDHTCYRRKKF
ncbi:hypothetical protein [Enterococcus sp. AZ192]|uniref:hypothetical protein n=1 Tax=unclassified Enterococcus TaxID=2608891 RepID=UPI003D29C8CA